MEILIQSIDQIHVFLFDCEIKNIAIASDAVRMYGFGNYNADRSEREYERIWFQVHTLHRYQDMRLWQVGHMPVPEFLYSGNNQSALSDSRADGIQSDLLQV